MVSPDYFMMHVSADGKSQTLPTLSIQKPICLKKAEKSCFSACLNSVWHKWECCLLLVSSFSCPQKNTLQSKPTIIAPQRSNKVLLGQFGKIGSILFEWRVTCYLRAATPTEKHIICANCCPALLVKLCLAPLFLCYTHLRLLQEERLALIASCHFLDVTSHR